MKNKLFSIIIPTFNRAHLIDETLDSILDQTCTNWECIIVDDGSNDNTEQVIKEYIKKDNRFQFFKRPKEKEKGVSSCRNFGFLMSKGDYVNFVDSDDVLTSNHLEIHCEMHEDIELDASVTNARNFISSIDNLKEIWAKNNSSELIFEMSANRVLWAIGTVVWKRNSLPEKPFKENLSNSEEWLFHIEQIINNLNYNVSNEVTYLVRSHEVRIGKIMSRQKCFSMFEARRILLNLFQERGVLTPEIEKELLNIMFSSLRASVANKYYKLLFKNSIYLLTHILKFKHKFKILKVVFISVPTYLVFGKGERLFKWN